MQKFNTEFGSEKIEVQIGGLAEQASGEVLVRQGDTVVLVTAVQSRNQREGIDYFPLMVDYEERFYAAGRIRGSRFMKREGRPSEEAILNSRLIDRTIRPRFNQSARQDVQIIATVLSWDAKNDPDLAAIMGASLALSISPISWDGPVAALRVGRIDGNFVLNPSYEEKDKSDLDLVISGDDKVINMMEAGAKEVGEDEFLKALEFGHGRLKKLIEFQKDITGKFPVSKKIPEVKPEDADFVKEIKNFLGNKLEQALFQESKTGRMDDVQTLKADLVAFLNEKYGEPSKIKPAPPASAMPNTLRAGTALFDKEIDRIVHEKILKEEKRVDGRKLDEVRGLECQAGFLPRTHGSGLFHRGTTQVLSILTLGAPGDKQLLEGMEIVGEKTFFHHYNFPPYSVGETGPMRGPGRREIGHGALAERGLEPIVPKREDFPYTIRVVSEVLSSNGSSSMASVCASSLALMDAGVPIARPAAGIAMGLMLEESEKPVETRKYKVLTDIQGPEDHHGDMDLKVAGTSKGITAIQMDVKVDGTTHAILKDAFLQAKKAREQILKKMTEAIAGPRSQLSPFAPKILTLQINPEKIRDVIGPGGKTINSIIDQTGVTIDVEDSGLIYVTAENEESVKQAIAIIKSITREYKVGEMADGKVTRILDFGAFVEIGPKQEGMIHISELAPRRVEKVTDVVKIGDKVTVKIIGIDELGRINLSLKQAKTHNT